MPHEPDPHHPPDTLPLAVTILISGGITLVVIVAFAGWPPAGWSWLAFGPGFVVTLIGFASTVGSFLRAARQHGPNR